MRREALLRAPLGKAKMKTSLLLDKESGGEPKICGVPSQSSGRGENHLLVAVCFPFLTQGFRARVYAARQTGMLAPPFGGDRGMEAQQGTRGGDLAGGPHVVHAGVTQAGQV